MNLKKYFNYAKEIGFSDVEFKTKRSQSFSIGVSHQNVEQYEVSDVTTYSIRGIYNGNMVSAQTENKASICAVLDSMKENAQLIEVKKEQELFSGSEKYRRMKKYVNEMAAVPASEKIALCMDLEKKCYAYNPLIKDVRIVSYSETAVTYSIENSRGLKLNGQMAKSSFGAHVIARNDSDTRVGSFSKSGVKMSDFDFDEIASKAGEEAVKALGGGPCKSGKYKTILSAGVFAQFLGYWLSAVDGDAVNKGKSLLKDSLNQACASKKLTVTEDPFSTEYPYMARAFDDEGVATYKKNIVENGVLKTFLYSIESAKEAGTVSTGNGYGGSDIGTGISLLTVKPGRRDLEGLAKSVKNGVLIKDVQGIHAGMNPMSGNFSLQANGYMIEKGEITSPLHLITIAGNLYEMFREITDLGNDCRMTGTKIYTPSAVVKSLAVSGK